MDCLLKGDLGELWFQGHHTIRASDFQQKAQIASAPWMAVFPSKGLPEHLMFLWKAGQSLSASEQHKATCLAKIHVSCLPAKLTCLCNKDSSVNGKQRAGEEKHLN